LEGLAGIVAALVAKMGFDQSFYQEVAPAMAAVTKLMWADKPCGRQADRRCREFAAIAKRRVTSGERIGR